MLDEELRSAPELNPIALEWLRVREPDGWH